MQLERSSGVLLHPTSLPSREGIGTLGREAYEFIDFLVSSRQKLWQIYPLGPTGYGDSPYQCFSAFAGNPLLISLDTLREEGLLTRDEITPKKPFSDDAVDFGPVIQFKMPLLKKAYNRFKEKASSLEKDKLEAFCEKHAGWLDDYATFMAIKEHFGGRPWNEWDKAIRMHESAAVAKFRKELEAPIAYQKFLQFVFFRQWHRVKSYANENGVSIVGDIPIFVAFDSADAWSNSDLFFFDIDRNPVKVAGVPPDYFSATGQLWGNPLYNWEKIASTGYKWWIDRIRSNFETVDIIRIDHFRGFAGYWAVPYGEKTAIKGQWEEGPGKDLFTAVENALGKLPIIAEDLGLITPDVIELRDHFQFPGMKILQFAFDSGEDNDYLPHNFPRNCAVYTGTHDNDTTAGWYAKAKPSDREYVNSYLNTSGKDIAWDFIRLAFASTAAVAVVPLQDVLSLGSEARMNTPGQAAGNWQWRFRKGALKTTLRDRLKHLTRIYKR